jgi:hypothetical protein
MDQRDVEQIVEEGHSAEDRDPPYQDPTGPVEERISAIVGPSVINRKSKDAGYLVVFKSSNSGAIGGEPG